SVRTDETIKMAVRAADLFGWIRSDPLHRSPGCFQVLSVAESREVNRALLPRHPTPDKQDVTPCPESALCPWDAPAVFTLIESLDVPCVPSMPIVGVSGRWRLPMTHQS
ncbi:hypothetical protein chiPu_0031718, partial [Chiloscyllium punctatum]|nr:hypothetical protein [Chiloscyllium punctatum]